MKTPDWLTLRDGGLRPGLNPGTWLVVLNQHPQYRLVSVPASGKFSCAITQMNNGKRMDAGKSYSSSEEAITGGLEELREKLGW